jgi:hypothetical protein
MLFETGNLTNGGATGVTGDFIFRPGTGAGGRGSIIFTDGTESGAGAGAVWTQAAADGKGSWVAPAAPAPSLSGTRAAPTAVTAAGGVVFSGSNYTNIYFLEGSGGPIDITATPQISVGTSVGQQLTIIGRNGTNTLTLDDGTGLSLNGSAVLGADSSITLLWDGTNWTEVSRR